jgi:2-polyprenyl-3-methyl-5-hydroxy-6-metoxy-1,4-benzoquinol methylase
LQSWYGELTPEKEQQLQEDLALLERLLLSGAPLHASDSPLRYLEVGCAFGHQLFCARRRGWNVIGVDYSLPAVNWIKEHLGIDAIHGTVIEVAESVPANSIDIVLMSHVLEHVTRPTEAISTVVSLLRPGGIVAIYVPNGGGLQARHDFSKWEWIDFPGHLYYFSPDTLHRLLAGGRWLWR